MSDIDKVFSDSIRAGCLEVAPRESGWHHAGRYCVVAAGRDDAHKRMVEMFAKGEDSGFGVTIE